MKLEEKGRMSLGFDSVWEDSHANVLISLLDPKVLNDVDVIKILQDITFGFQRVHDQLLSRVSSIARSFGLFDLLHGNHFTSCSVESQVNFAIAATPDEFATNPFHDL